VLNTPDANVLSACRTLFGAESVSPEFLLSLKPHILKIAFRKKAKETHPDLFTAHGPVVQKRQAELFRVVNEAYNIMRNYCERRDRMRVHIQQPMQTPRRAKSSTRSFRVVEEGWLYRGVVPERRHEIGRYLYYRGCIPYHALLKALEWQMRQRPALGTIAKSWGWLNDHHISSIIRFRGMPRLFGQRALHLGFLSSYQARILLAYQRTLQKKLGQYFVDNGHLSRTEMERLVTDLNNHNARFAYAAVAEWRSL
jgi:curved DNA-binding protein CbpA